VRTFDRALENGQLLTQRHVLERDGSVTTTEQSERSKQNDNRGQHALSCRPIDPRINRWSWRSGFGEPQLGNTLIAGAPARTTGSIQR
jgi:hypothetical protein